jgi:hypothetical protein
MQLLSQEDGRQGLVKMAQKLSKEVTAVVSRELYNYVYIPCNKESTFCGVMSSNLKFFAVTSLDNF